MPYFVSSIEREISAFPPVDASVFVGASISADFFDV